MNNTSNVCACFKNKSLSNHERERRERERYSIPILPIMEESNQLADLVLGGIRTAVLEAWRPTCYHFARERNDHGIHVQETAV